MNLHEINKVIRDHLIKQRSQAVLGAAEACAYRSDDGKMCAVGCLIDENHYSEYFEENSVTDRADLVEAVCDSVGFIPETHHELILLGNVLSQWQGYHDTERRYKDWCDGGSLDSPKRQYHKIEGFINEPTDVSEFIYPAKVFKSLCEKYNLEKKEMSYDIEHRE